MNRLINKSSLGCFSTIKTFVDRHNIQFFDEPVTFFNSRNLHYKAVEVGNRLLLSPDIELVEIDRTLFNRGWPYFQKYQDKSYSLTDCLSFIVIKQREIVTALTLDRHFL